MSSVNEIVDQAAKNLLKYFSKDAIPAGRIKREIEHIGGYKKDSVLPSDYCYNIVNIGSAPLEHAVFEWIGRGRYRYLGHNYNYNGPVYWKGDPVGEWKSGVCKLKTDPRNYKK